MTVPPRSCVEIATAKLDPTVNPPKGVRGDHQSWYKLFDAVRADSRAANTIHNELENHFRVEKEGVTLFVNRSLAPVALALVDFLPYRYPVVVRVVGDYAILPDTVYFAPLHSKDIGQAMWRQGLTTPESADLAVALAYKLATDGPPILGPLPAHVYVCTVVQRVCQLGLLKVWRQAVGLDK